MKEVAAEQLHLTAEEMHGFGLVDGIIPEPDGGAHWDYDLSAQIVKEHIIPVLNELKQMSPEERINKRIEKFGKMGFWEEVEDADHSGEMRDDSGVGSRQLSESGGQPIEESRQSAVGSEQTEVEKREMK
jgi:hypothetical protein